MPRKKRMLRLSLWVKTKARIVRPGRRTTGAIVILLDRKHDAWLARWSGANAWFVKPADPFELADRVLELVTEKESA